MSTVYCIMKNEVEPHTGYTFGPSLISIHADRIVAETLVEKLNLNQSQDWLSNGNTWTEKGKHVKEYELREETIR